MQIQFARELMEGLGLNSFRPIQSAQPLRQRSVASDSVATRDISRAMKAYRRKRQLAHRTARRQHMINRAKGKAYRYG